MCGFHPSDFNTSELSLDWPDEAPGFGATHRVQSLKSPRLQPLARARFRTQRIQETYALQQETVLEVFTED